MQKRILVPIDKSVNSDAILELATELFPGETLVFLHVIDPADAGFTAEAAIPTFPDGWYEQQKAQAESTFDDLESGITDHSVVVEREIDLGKPASSIIEFAAAHPIDHIVMGSTTQQGVSRLLMGSVAERVIRDSPVPVTVVK